VGDFGNQVDPIIVEARVRGGPAQGLGQARLAACVYDPGSGQLLTGTPQDFAMPRADDLPSFKVDHAVSGCAHNPLDLKGCGGAGSIGSPPALIDALTDKMGLCDIAMSAMAGRARRAASARPGPRMN